MVKRPSKEQLEKKARRDNKAWVVIMVGVAITNWVLYALDIISFWWVFGILGIAMAVFMVLIPIVSSGWEYLTREQKFSRKLTHHDLWQHRTYTHHEKKMLRIKARLDRRWFRGLMIWLPIVAISFGYTIVVLAIDAFGGDIPILPPPMQWVSLAAAIIAAGAFIYGIVPVLWFFRKFPEWNLFNEERDDALQIYRKSELEEIRSQRRLNRFDR